MINFYLPSLRDWAVGEGEVFSNVFITKAEYPQNDNNSYKSLRKRNKANLRSAKDLNR